MKNICFTYKLVGIVLLAVGISLPNAYAAQKTLAVDISQQRHFDIKAKELPIKKFLIGLVDGMPFNIIVHPDVRGMVTLELYNVTIEEVLKVMRETHGIEYDKIGSTYTISKSRLITKIFQINYLNFKRTGVSDVMVGSANDLSSSGESGSSGDTSSEDSSSGDSTGGSSSGSQVRTTTASNFWNNLVTTLESIINIAEKGAVSDKGGKSVIVNPETGLVVVKAYQNELRTVQEYLELAQNIVTRQVVIEAKILEVVLSEGFQSGINWSSLTQFDKNSTAIARQVGGGSLINNGPSEIANSGISSPSTISNGIIEGGVANAFGGMFSLAFNFGSFNTFIELLETQGDVQVLSSPRIASLNNQKSVIKVGSDEFFVTGIKSNENNSGSSSTKTTYDVTLKPFFSGIALDVTSQINDNGEVVLHIHPAVSEVQEKTKNLSIGDKAGGSFLSLPMALSSVRESDSLIVARDGQLVVIGGLIQNVAREQEANVPVLSKIPILGRLFQHKKQVMEKSELIIVLRPTIINSGSGSQVSEKVESRINRLETESRGH